MKTFPRTDRLTPNTASNAIPIQAEPGSGTALQVNSRNR
jgi:hypothetical protein